MDLAWWHGAVGVVSSAVDPLRICMSKSESTEQASRDIALVRACMSDGGSWVFCTVVWNQNWIRLEGRCWAGKWKNASLSIMMAWAVLDSYAGVPIWQVRILMFRGKVRSTLTALYICFNLQSFCTSSYLEQKG